MFKKVVVKNQLASFSPRAGLRLVLIGLAMLTLSQSVGCKLGLHETAMVTYRDYVWAKRAFNLRYGNCDRPYAEHFESGFCAGYEAMCNGGDGYVPALPAEEYRSYEYQSVDGARCVNSWFEGYPAGVAAAKKDKAGTYHDVLISRMINSAVKQEKTQAVLPADVPVVAANQAQRPASGMNAPRVQPPTYPSYMPSNNMPSVLQKGTFDAPPQAMTAPPKLPEIVPATLPEIVQADYVPQPKLETAPTSNQPLPMATVPASWNSTRRNQ